MKPVDYTDGRISISHAPHVPPAALARLGAKLEVEDDNIRGRGEYTHLLFIRTRDDDGNLICGIRTAADFHAVERMPNWVLATSASIEIFKRLGGKIS